MKAFFLDRDGVLNVERGEYTYRINDFEIIPGTIPVLKQLKSLGYLLIVITNQAGIAKGIYTKAHVLNCYAHLQQESDSIFDDLYYCPWHPDFSESLSRKPGTLMFERAIAKFGIDPHASYMVGDKERDLIPAKKLGIKTVLLGPTSSDYADIRISELSEMLSQV